MNCRKQDDKGSVVDMASASVQPPMNIGDSVLEYVVERGERMTGLQHAVGGRGM